MNALLRYLLWLGLLVFLVSVGIAVALYPGGNRFDLHDPHYSFFGNFLCDLFHKDGYNGLPNIGRTYALVGTHAAALTLLLYWILLPRLFPTDAIKLRKYVRIFGATAMSISLLIATPLHDWCINISVPIGVVAFVLSIAGLRKSGKTFLARLGILALAMCVINYLSLILRIFPESLPGIQKITLFVFFAWVIAGIRSLPQRPDRAPGAFSNPNPAPLPSN